MLPISGRALAERTGLAPYDRYNLTPIMYHLVPNQDK